MARSAQIHKSISFIWVVWSTLYVYLWSRIQSSQVRIPDVFYNIELPAFYSFNSSTKYAILNSNLKWCLKAPSTMSWNFQACFPARTQNRAYAHHCTVHRLMAPDGTQWSYLLFNANKSCWIALNSSKTATEILKPYTVFCFDFQSFVNVRLYKLVCKCMTALLAVTETRIKDPR